MNRDIALSVIVPVLNGRAILPESIGAVLASDLARDEWELIVVDDGSSDGSGEWAREHVDLVLEVDDGPLGPGCARNRAAARARGSILVFVDADVCVHTDALSKFRRAFEAHEHIGAVFGAYDDSPRAPEFLSQYRNLYHRYVHLMGAGEAETFWAGCGAVRRELFLSLGGFDTVAYPRPQIEDIELGYRIRDRGWTVLLDPTIEATHLKRWTLKSIVKTDLLDRGVPWMRLLLGDGPEGPRRGTLNVGGFEKFKIAAMGVATASTLIGIALWEGRLVLVAAACLAVIVLMNLPVYAWFAARRSWSFAAGVIPLNLLYYFISGLAAFIGITLHFTRRPAPRVTGAATERESGS